MSFSRSGIPCGLDRQTNGFTDPALTDGRPRELVRRIVSRGFHLVEVSHGRDPDRSTEWRFSFSVAERMLIRSWTDEQKYVYHILRLIKKMVIRETAGKATLSTYHFKTLMLWACEKKPKTFWSYENFETVIDELLLRMVF